MTNNWRPSRSEQVRYFLVASFLLIIPIVGLLFLGLWLGQRVSYIVGVLGAVIGGMAGLASGTFSLYRMALKWERNVLEKLGKKLCPKCKKSFEMGALKCPHCEYETAPTTQILTQSE